MNLLQKIKTKKAKVGIIGLGYVGLPLAVEFANKGFFVIGIDKDKQKVNSLRQGISYITDVPSDIIKSVINKKTFFATTDYSVISDLDAVIICVPTPLRKTGDPDISFIISSVENILQYVHPNILIILESTSYPGTTRELILPKIQQKKLEVGKDFYLSFSPERIDPGNKKYGLKNTPKVVGGITPKCRELAATLYQQICEKVIPVSSTEAAEMVKLLENSFRSINIALVNEIALICDKLNLNVWEIINAASSKPFGFIPFYPGPGVGGHCISIDPHYLSWKMKELNFYTRMIDLAGEINSKMPEFVVNKIIRILNKDKKCLKNSKILILGVAYKKDVSDTRESPALDIINLLLKEEAKVNYNDPYVSYIEVNGAKLKSKNLSPALLRNSDCVVITTDHSIYNYSEIVKQAKRILDTRNATKNIRNKKIATL